MEFLSLFKNSQKPANNNLNVGQKRKRQSTRIVNEPYLYGMAFYISQEMFERYIGITYVSQIESVLPFSNWVKQQPLMQAAKRASLQ